MKVSLSRVFEVIVSVLILSVGIYTLYTGPGEQIVSLVRARVHLNVRPLASIAIILGSLLMLDSATGHVSRAFRGRVAYRELALLAVPFYIAGASLIVLVILRYDISNATIAIAYMGGLTTLYIALWLTQQSLTSSPLSLEIRRHDLRGKIPWYLHLSRLKVRSSTPVEAIAKLLRPLANRLYEATEEAGLPYTRGELQTLLAASAFAGILSSAGIAIALAPWAGAWSLLTLLLPILFTGGVALYILMKREERREYGEKNALWLALVAGIASRLGIPFHRLLRAAGMHWESARASRLIALGHDPLEPLLSHPSETVRTLTVDYQDIATSGGDPYPAMKDWQERLLEEHRTRMERYAEEAATLLEAMLIMLGLGPLVVLLAGTLQGSIALLRLYTTILLPLGVTAAAILAERLPKDEAERPPPDTLTWAMAGMITGVAVGTILRASPSITIAVGSLGALALYTLKTRSIHEAEEVEKREAPSLLRILAETARTGIPLLRALEARARDGSHPHLKDLYRKLADGIRRTGELNAHPLHETMRRTLSIARLLHQAGASPYEIEQVKRYIEAIIRAESGARARLKILIALVPLLPIIITYTLKLAVSHITRLNTIPSISITGEIQGGSITPPSIPWELIRMSIILASLGLGLIAGRIYYGRWDNMRLALLSVTSSLFALLLL